MTRKEFEEIKNEKGYDCAITELYWEVENKKFLSYLDIKDVTKEAIDNNELNKAIAILNVVNNPPELDCGFYYYDKNSDEPPVNLDNEDLIEKYIGFDIEDYED
jgi:hypothetical protein